MRFTAEIQDGCVHATLTPDRDLSDAIFCCSGMGPWRVISGGSLRSQTGSFLELALPDLAAEWPHEIVLSYGPEARAGAANRAWLPLGAYLRTSDGPVPLPRLPSGVRRARTERPAPFDGLRLVPEPTDWSPAGGDVATTGFATDRPALALVAALAGRLGRAFHDPAGLPVRVSAAQTPPEGYRLTVASDVIGIEAADDAGVFHAGITLLQLLHLHDGRVPLGVIEDAPRFVWRGQHLDCARHCYATRTILHLLDLMAILKLNRFHWHFHDDEAQRLRTDASPELWQATAMSGEGHLLPAFFGEGIAAGGTYAPAEVDAILSRAQANGIAILPEIETPAHALALCRVYPDLRDPADTGTERSVQGYAANVVNPAMPGALDRLGALAADVAGRFPFGHIHLGSDELPEGTWTGSPAARALMEAEGLATTHDLQGWTMAQIADRLPGGIRPCAWEEAARGCQGGIGHDALLFSWTGQAPGIAAARAGYDIVMCPAQHTYLDMAATPDTDDWGANWAAHVSLADTLDWDPVPEPDIAPRIAGVQACFWSEFTTRDGEIWPMLMPRLLGVASVAWSQTRRHDAGDLSRLAHHLDTLWPPAGLEIIWAGDG